MVRRQHVMVRESCRIINKVEHACKPEPGHIRWVVLPKRILILGGGTGGLIAAKTLAHKLHGKADAEITLITNSPWHDFQPLYFDIALGTATPEEARAPIEALQRFGVKVLVENVQHIDLANRAVRTDKGVHTYDYLLVALGVRYGWEAYPGLAEAGYHNYTMEGALELAQALARFKGGRVVLLVPETPHRCGMYPHEAVTTLAETFKKRGLNAQVTIMTPEKGPMGALSSEFPKIWLRKYEEYGVERIIHNGLQEIDPQRRIIRAGNVEEKYDLLIKVPPSRLPEPLAKSEGFQWKQDPRWAPVKNPRFRHPDYDEVYLTGEHSMPPAGLPTAGIPVHFASEYAAYQIASDVLGGLPVPGLTRVMTCVGYYGATGGFAANCEANYSEKDGKWKLGCYGVSTSPIIRLMKEAFYKAWIASLK